MAVREVIKMGHPTLRKVSYEVVHSDITSDTIQILIDDLIETMNVQNGIGIAAPQVDVLQRIFIFRLPENDKFPDREIIPVTVAVNPKIEVIGDEIQERWESCLSMPYLMGKVSRPNRVRLTAHDRHGVMYQKRLSGMAACLVQHELDHLDGKLYTDRMSSLDTLIYEDVYKYWKDQT